MLIFALVSVASAEDLKTTVDGEYAQYADSTATYVYTPAVAVGISHPLNGWSVGGSGLIDVVSAASVDIVSTASPAWQEVRYAGSANATYRPKLFGVTVGGSVSREPDYLSLSGGGNLSIELRDKTVTPLLGYTYTHDTAGRRGTPFDVYSLVLRRHTLSAAVNIVVNRETTLSFVADAMLERGHQEKPYRYVPLFTPEEVDQVRPGMPGDQVNDLRIGRVFENLPTSRNRYALALRLAQRLQTSTFTLWERLYADDWGLVASTTDIRMLFDAGKRFYIWPHLRGHFQSSVSFWKLAYSATVVDGLVDVPELRTGDRELSPLQAFTGGLGMRYNVGSPRPEAASFVLTGDINLTRYSDALFITDRISGIGALQFQAEF